ncbi:glycosyltransferase [Marivirga atlantica]|uniref:Acylneuraminate cytidylyltransferase n=1 Tax=Marivirga atlantica TaxID=1548457 RepID=A0A937DEI2_9BACT|nr:acylneuraminate cytidylyltransferase [Marivirga atlantica]MBL0765242.1 acylneuraminate cytidylyltransferase [Marivirga atlantica]
MNILVIIPARGGSKGIPRKNLRPLRGKPLISYSIQTALGSAYKPDVYVSTDDDEIAFIAKKFQAKIHKRNPDLAKDATTLDPVIYYAWQEIAAIENKQYDYVITLQPTSPLLVTSSLDKAIQKAIDNSQIETIIAAVNDTHLTWRKEKNGFFLPNYKARLNRQQLPQVYKETGSFFISRTDIIRENSRIGKEVDLYILPEEQAIDIDSFQDWSVCEYLLSRKRIVFSVSGYPEIGLGHVYNCLILASELVDHELIFLVDEKSELAFNKISAYNYKVLKQQAENLVDDVIGLKPDAVINDRLDTSISYIRKINKAGILTINFEDLGAGALEADLVINAIYPEQTSPENHYFGPQYFCAREEFYLHEEKTLSDKVERVLISFGGTDPNNYTQKVLNAIYDKCITSDIQIDVVLGLGYQHKIEEREYNKAIFHYNVNNISDFMFAADIAFSSAGRTVYELALAGTPSIIMAQNERELTHFFASEENGFINLGLGIEVEQANLVAAFENLLEHSAIRISMHEKMKKNRIEKGRSLVIKLIRKTLNKET